VVKHSFIVKQPEDIPNIVWKAFHIATTGRPGPVVIDVPKDTTDPDVTAVYSYPKKLKLRSYNPAVKGNGRQIRKAAAALLAAKRPVIYAGGGVVIGDGAAELTRLARTLDYPVTNTLMGLGGFPGTDRQFLGMLGMHGTFESNMAMHHADLILAVGARFDDRVTNNPAKFCPDATIIHIDVDPASISKIIEADIPIVGQVASVLQDLNDAVEGLRKNDPSKPDAKALARWWERIEGWRQAHGLDHHLAVEPGKPILPQQVIQSLYRVTGGNAFVTSDVGQHQMFAAQYYRFDQPRRWINSGGLGTMGFGLPAAMGVQFAYPDATVACVTGEGSFMMNMQELSTCLQYGLPIKIVALNNQALGMVKQWQDMQYGGRHSQSTYSDSLPDFKTLVEAFGHVGFKVEHGADLEPVMAEAFGPDLKRRLVFVDVWVDPNEHVYPMAIKGGAMQDMHLSKITTSIQGDYM